jgi:hypothetical protein
MWDSFEKLTKIKFSFNLFTLNSFPVRKTDTVRVDKRLLENMFPPQDIPTEIASEKVLV